MRDTSEPPRTRPDLVWGQITRETESGSFIEDQLAALVDRDAASADGLRLDVIHIIHIDQGAAGS